MLEKRRKFNIVLICINAAILAVFGIACLAVDSLREKYSSDSVRQLWESDDTAYVQISLFLPYEDGLDFMGVYSLRQNIEDKLKETSVASADNKDDGLQSKGRLWLDCASGELTSVTLKGPCGSSDVILTATMGDYFLFHPEKLISGSYYTDEDINLDRIVIDKLCSWQLFGALDTAGMSVELGNKIYYIAAVVDTPEDETDLLAYGKVPRVYMPFRTAVQYNQAIRMTSYEVCMPEPVKDHSLQLMTEADPSSGNGILIDQSGRFDLITLVSGFSELSESVMVNSSLRYPWYENRTRSAELNARLTAFPATVLLIIPALSSVYLLFVLSKLLGKAFGYIRSKAENAYQKKISEAYYKKHNIQK